jgi:hypothetical protein
MEPLWPATSQGPNGQDKRFASIDLISGQAFGVQNDPQT